MERGIKLFLVIAFALHPCDGVSLRRQLQHIIDSRLQSLNHEILPSRRFYTYDPREVSSILGVPSIPSHLPEAEPILPGHTLLRPAIGMLKSSLKFPHKDLEDGAGVYGNIDNLGIRYDARNERLLYSGFRRFPSDYIMVVPTKGTYYGRPRFKLVPTVLDMVIVDIINSHTDCCDTEKRCRIKKPLLKQKWLQEQKDKTKNDLLKILKRLNILKGAKVFVANLGGNNLNMPAKKDLSNYLNLNGPNKAKLHSHMLRTSATAEEGSVEKQKESISNEQPMNGESRERKMKLLLESKDLYNNIKIQKNAPELKQLMPNEYQEDNIRKWWYYNADDYTPFDD